VTGLPSTGGARHSGARTWTFAAGQLARRVRARVLGAAAALLRFGVDATGSLARGGESGMDCRGDKRMRVVLRTVRRLALDAHGRESVLDEGARGQPC